MDAEKTTTSTSRYRKSERLKKQASRIEWPVRGIVVEALVVVGVVML